MYSILISLQTKSTPSEPQAPRDALTSGNRAKMGRTRENQGTHSLNSREKGAAVPERRKAQPHSAAQHSAISERRNAPRATTQEKHCHSQPRPPEKPQCANKLPPSHKTGCLALTKVASSRHRWNEPRATARTSKRLPPQPAAHRPLPSKCRPTAESQSGLPRPSPQDPPGRDRAGRPARRCSHPRTCCPTPHCSRCDARPTHPPSQWHEHSQTTESLSEAGKTSPRATGNTRLDANTTLVAMEPQQPPTAAPTPLSRPMEAFPIQGTPKHTGHPSGPNRSGTENRATLPEMLQSTTDPGQPPSNRMLPTCPTSSFSPDPEHITSARCTKVDTRFAPCSVGPKDSKRKHRPAKVGSPHTHAPKPAAARSTPTSRNGKQPFLPLSKANPREGRRQPSCPKKPSDYPSPRNTVNASPTHPKYVEGFDLF